MKNIAPAAMAAIEAGEAIVSGAVAILPLDLVNYTLVSVVNLHAVNDAATTPAGGLATGVTLSGFAPGDVIRVSLPSGQTYVAWSPWGDPTPADPGNSGTRNLFSVIPDAITANVFNVGDGIVYDGYEAARAAFGTATFTGASSYTFYIPDTAPGDNSGGLSIRVERGVAVGAADAVRVWGGYGPLVIGGETYQGIGARGLAQQNAGAVGGVAQGLVLSLSRLEAAALDLLDADVIKRAAVVLYRLVFASDGKTLLDAHVWDRGRVDTVDSDEEIGGEAAIMIAVESAARGLGRSGGRRRSDSDQRLIDPDDGYFKHAAFAGQKVLWWGGKKPSYAGVSR